MAIIKNQHSPNPDKKSKLRIWGVLSPILLAGFFLCIPYLPSNFENTHPLLSLTGRFHPLVLHFPIVILVLTLLFLVLGKFHSIFEHPLIIKSLLVLGCVSSLAALLAGYFLYATEDYAGDLVRDHLWGGVLTGIGICLSTSFYFYFLDGKHTPGAQTAFLSLILVTNLVLGYTSHVGGSLTHGQEFLTEPLSRVFPKKDLPVKPLEELLVYEDVIHTLLESKCLNCHNENKTKGGLLMTNYENLLKAGDSGKPSVIPGNPEESELLVRVHLPVSDDERMPPEGKPGLTSEEISLITYWIKHGAEKDKLVATIQDDSEISSNLSALLPKIQQTQQRLALEREEFEQMAKELSILAEKLQIQIEPDPESDKLSFRLRMKFPPRPFSNTELLELSPYFPYFSSVSLASADISDDELFFIGKMENLQRLFIQKTRVDGSGIPYLHSHAKLETLNISFTPLIPGNVFHLLEIPNLKKVYIFGTPVKPDIVSALQTYRPDIEFHMEEGPLF